MSQNYFQQLVFESEPVPIDFASLPPSLHEEPDQIRRRITAKKIKADNIVDCGDHYMVTGSSGDTYTTNINSCTCFDFVGRGLPCKHIYRFAMDHELIGDLPKIKPKQAKLFEEKISAEVERFRLYYEQGIISAEKYLKIVDAIQKGK